MVEEVELVEFSISHLNIHFDSQDFFQSNSEMDSCAMLFLGCNAEKVLWDIQHRMDYGVKTHYLDLIHFLKF